MCIMIWFPLLILTVTFIYWKLKSYRNFWISKGVQQDTNGSLFGDNLRAIMRKETFPEMIQRAYDMYPNTRYSGFYQFFQPVLVIKDPDLIKKIAVKDFDHFPNHQNFIPEDAEPLFSKNLFVLRDQKWRDMRSNLSPAFTSSKMKYMFALIVQNCENFVQHFSQNEDVITVEMKDVFSRFTNDMIASVAFGIDVDSLNDPKNEFYVMGKDLTDLSGFVKIMKLFGSLLMPQLFKMCKISPFSPTTIQFFSKIIKNNIDSRRTHNIVRSDMINILLECKKHGIDTKLEESSKDTGFATALETQSFENQKSRTEITDLDIISQAITFFFAGFDTVSGLMSFMSYELAINPEVQIKLIEEIDKLSKCCSGKITYENLLSMKYMDMVVSETLRKWPNFAVNDRVCTKPYVIPPAYPDEKPLLLEKDSLVWFPIYALHRDPKYYPEPDRFDPERFNDENKPNIRPYTYMPFGLGPRSCIGSRLALLEVKALFFHILANFEFIPVEKTQIPLQISKKKLHLTAEGGFWLGLKRRIRD